MILFQNFPRYLAYFLIYFICCRWQKCKIKSCYCVLGDFVYILCSLVLCILILLFSTWIFMAAVIFIVDGIFYQNTSPWIQYLLILISWPLLSSFIIFMVCNMFYSSAVLFCFSVCFLNWPFHFSSYSPLPTIVLFFFDTVFQRLYSLLNFSFFFKECFLRSRVYYLHSFLSSLLSLLLLLHVDSFNVYGAVLLYLFIAFMLMLQKFLRNWNTSMHFSLPSFMTYEEHKF